jgi:hypothetical protein
MWEDLTIALVCAGFVAAVALFVLELPAVVAAAQQYARQRQVHR